MILQARFRLAVLSLWLLVPTILGFLAPVAFRRHQLAVFRKSTTTTTIWSNNQDVEEEQQQDESSIDDDIEVPDPELDAQEKVWRFAKKPLLRIGAKGATHAHGNSLRQLLEDHTVVKVKVNTKKFGTVAKASETLRELAIENGAPADIEMIQVREGQKEILFGMPGTVKRVEDGSFPPPPPPPEEEKEEDEEEEGKLSE